MFSAETDKAPKVCSCSIKGSSKSIIYITSQMCVQVFYCNIALYCIWKQPIDTKLCKDPEEHRKMGLPMMLNMMLSSDAQPHGGQQ